MTDMGRKVTIGLTVPIVGLAAVALKTSISMESAWTGTRKTLKATADELPKLEKGFLDLSLKVPLLAEEIFGIGEAAGQLNIQNKHLVSFTKTMADFASAATSINAKDAAIKLARFAKATHMPQKNFDRLASTIVELGNTYEVTEQEIVTMATRMAASGRLAGMNQADIVGMAAAMRSLGVEMEAGSSAVSRVLFDMSKEIGTGSQKVKDFATISGISVKKFETLWKKGGANALIKFSKGLADFNKKGVSAGKILEHFGWDGIRVGKTLLLMADGAEGVKEALADANKEWETNSALIHESNERYKTAASRLGIFRNRLRLLAKSFGDELKPMLMAIVVWLKPFVDWLEKLSPKTKAIISLILGLVAVLGPLIMAIGLVASVIAAGFISAPVVGTLSAVAAAFIGIAAAVATVALNFKELKKEFGPLFKEMKMFIDWANQFTSPGKIAGSMASGIRGFRNRDQVGLDTREIAPPDSSHRSQTDVNIKVSSDSGSTAVVEGVKSKGGSNVQVMNESNLGMNLAYGH
jgi:TP901 family phage tail tape measure protein